MSNEHCPFPFLHLLLLCTFLCVVHVPLLIDVVFMQGGAGRSVVPNPCATIIGFLVSSSSFCHWFGSLPFMLSCSLSCCFVVQGGATRSTNPHHHWSLSLFDWSEHPPPIIASFHLHPFVIGLFVYRSSSLFLLGEHYLLPTIIGLHATFVFPFMLFYCVRGVGKKGEL